jgi:hypothetical protein
MERRDRRVVMWSRWLWALGLAACVMSRSEASLRNELAAYVNTANQCTDSAECGVAWGACPLDCYMAVRADRRSDVEEKARRLAAESGKECEHSCTSPGGVICVGGRCTFGYAQPPPGTGGSSSGTGGDSTGSQGGVGGAGGRGTGAGGDDNGVSGGG